MLETADQISLIPVNNIGFECTHLDQDYALSLMGGSSPELDDLLEGLTIWAYSMCGSDEIIRAREQFQLDTGKVFPEDPMHLARTAYFFDYFLFERSIRQGRDGDCLLLSATPYEIFCSRLDRNEPYQSEIMGRLRGLGDFRHSLFVIERVHPRSLVVRDIISRQKMNVSAKERESFRALTASQIIQGFLYRFGDHYQLSPGIVLHPPSANKILKSLVSSLQKDLRLSRVEILPKLAYINMRHIRLKHVDPRTTYKSETDAYLSAVKMIGSKA